VLCSRVLVPSDDSHGPDEQVTQYADPRVPAINDELSKHAVGIMPMIEKPEGHDVDPLQQGSGTCIRIGGRFFVATAAHVIQNYPQEYYAVFSPEPLDGAVKIRGGGKRGGGNGERDIAWLELTSGAAALLRRSFLDLARIAPYHDGKNDDLCVYGAPLQDRTRGELNGKPVYSAGGSMWATRAPSPEELPREPKSDEVHLLWPRSVVGHDGERYDYPEASGISGGAVWALNVRGHDQDWRADQAQLIGIEFAQRKEHACRHLVAQRMWCWLEMVAEDVPELRDLIETHLKGSSLMLAR
jgi:hypothetical protein